MEILQTYLGESRKVFGELISSRKRELWTNICWKMRTFSFFPPNFSPSKKDILGNYDKIVFTIASCGIAATLLQGGKTAHSTSNSIEIIRNQREQFSE